mgnify:CR=1 FL=1
MAPHVVDGPLRSWVFQDIQVKTQGDYRIGLVQNKWIKALQIV